MGSVEAGSPGRSPPLDDLGPGQQRRGQVPGVFGRWTDGVSAEGWDVGSEMGVPGSYQEF